MDITQPLDAINVATFIAYIVLVYAPQMRQLFSDSLDEAARQQHLSSLASEPIPLVIARSMTKAPSLRHGWFYGSSNVQ